MEDNRFTVKAALWQQILYPCILLILYYMTFQAYQSGVKTRALFFGFVSLVLTFNVIYYIFYPRLYVTGEGINLKGEIIPFSQITRIEHAPRGKTLVNIVLLSGKQIKTDSNFQNFGRFCEIAQKHGAVLDNYVLEKSGLMKR